MQKTKNSKDITLSKSLSWLLRHSAVEEGLRLSPEGYLDVDTVLQHKSFRGYNLSDIERVVRNNEKQRFQLRVDPGTRSLQIKANQGHSISTVTDAGLTPILEVKYQIVIHGTFLKCWPQIKRNGLSRMQRRHIHLAKGSDNTVISGLRSNAQIHIYINLEKALKDGITFYESDNGVILTAGNDKGFLETKYFDKVVEVATGECYPVSVMELCSAGAMRVPVRPPPGKPPFSRPPAPVPPFAAPPRPPPVVAAAREPRPAAPARDSWRRRRAAPDQDYANMVQVTGFPAYTQPQDLAHAFAAFGPVVVRGVRAGAAALAFAAAGGARAALRASRAVNIYGEFLDVTPYRGQLEEPPPNKREMQKIKQKAAMVDPASIPWTGDFHAQLDALLAAVRLSQPEVQRLAALYRDLEAVLQEPWPGCRAIPFGSVTTGLGVKSSDADCFVLLPRGAPAAAAAVPRARRVLAQHPRLFAELLAIPRANTPIVKCYHLPTRTHCDLSFKTPLGAQNSKLVSFLLHADPRLLPLAVALKYYAAVHDLTGTGKLTNYALTMLIVFYLQQPPRALLPAVEWLQRDRRHDVLVDGWNTGFMDAHALLPPRRDAASIADLLGGFFEYYAAFDFDELVVCPYLGRPLPKAAFKDTGSLPAEFERYKANVTTGASLALRFNTAVCVQDPFEQCHNVASPVTSRLAADVRAYFKFAADAYAREKAVDCRHFLETVLLERPKLPRGKANPEFRVGLAPALLAGVAPADWKAVARGVVMEAFETILMVKLKNAPGTPERTDKGDRNPDSKDDNSETQDEGNIDAEKDDLDTEQVPDNNDTKKDPEDPAAKKEKPKPKRERERYTGSLTRTVWKRKQFSKLFSVMGLKFVDREKKITEEILNYNNNAISLEFQLIITFCASPRSAVVAVRYIAGELDNYREFGKFMVSTMQHWFVTLCKPHCNPKKRERKKKPKKDKEEKREESEEAAAAGDEGDEPSDDEPAEPAPQPADDDGAASDSDSVSSYEDERIDPNAQPRTQNDTDKSQSDGDLTPPDANKENVNASNSVKKQSDSGDVDKHKHANSPVKNLSDDKTSKLQSHHDKPDVPGDASGNKTKSNEESDKNE